MRLILTLFVLVAFFMGASGLAKAVEAQNTMNAKIISISQIKLHSQENATKCCSGEEEQSDTQSPRCIGDICVENPSAKPNQLGFGNKLPMTALAYIGMGIHTSFLRPPIA